MLIIDNFGSHMKIIILRHGLATYSNADRVLSDEGIKEVANTAMHLAKHYRITKCFCSPKTRAVQTATIACEHFKFKEKIEYLKELTPSGDPALVISFVEASCSEKDVVLIVSHLPLVETLAYEFTRRTKLPPQFDTACALVLDYSGNLAHFNSFYAPFDDQVTY